VIEQQRLAYLKALDIAVWLPRTQQPSNEAHCLPCCVRLGPGTGETLVVCDRPDQSSGSLASDIVRSLGGVPVWAWLDDSASGLSLAEAVQDRLFTGLIVFGHGLAERLLGDAIPERLGPARVLVTDDIDTLGRSAGARRELWRQLCLGGLVSTP
jgi:DNA polymerase III psi subunit